MSYYQPMAVSWVPQLRFVTGGNHSPRPARVPRCEFGFLHDPLDWICPHHPNPANPELNSHGLETTAHGRPYITRAIRGLLKPGKPMDRFELHKRLAAKGVHTSNVQFGCALRELRSRGIISGSKTIKLAEV